MEGEGTDISAVDRWWRDGFSCLCEAAAELNQVRALAVGGLDVEGVGQIGRVLRWRNAVVFRSIMQFVFSFALTL